RSRTLRRRNRPLAKLGIRISSDSEAFLPAGNERTIGGGAAPTGPARVIKSIKSEASLAAIVIPSPPIFRARRGHAAIVTRMTSRRDRTPSLKPLPRARILADQDI